MEEKLMTRDELISALAGISIRLTGLQKEFEDPMTIFTPHEFANILSVMNYDLDEILIGLIDDKMEAGAI